MRAGNPNWWEWADGFWQNFGTEMFGAILTFALIEVLVGARKEKTDIVKNMSSLDNSTALGALRQARENGWLEDGILEGSMLVNANLANADLGGAKLKDSSLFVSILDASNLSGADLSNVNLFESSLVQAKALGVNFELTDLGKSNLDGIWLANANLKHSSLREASIRFAWLAKTNLESAHLRRANLEGSEFGDANLKNAWLADTNLLGAKYLTIAQLRDAASLSGATLPEGTKLSTTDNWKAEFEVWAESATTEYTTDFFGTGPGPFIVPKPIETPPELTSEWPRKPGSKNIKEADRLQCTQRLSAHGYRVIEAGFDTLAYKFHFLKSP